MLTPQPTHAADERLRQRLTEREDKRRPVEPWSVDVAGRPLTASGEYEIALESVRRRGLGKAAQRPDRLVLSQGVEAEAFYSFGPALSLFAQLRAEMRESLRSNRIERTSELFAERGEMWLYGENIAGSRFNFDIGRLRFEDDRRWWWDDELDAIRLAYENAPLEIVAAYGRELSPHRLDRGSLSPEDEGIHRVLAELSWDFTANHALNLFVLRQDDRSARAYPGQAARRGREDESDARLTWWGLCLMGAFGLQSTGVFGYWLDSALVRGVERLAAYQTLTPRRSVVDTLVSRPVRGWAFDAGMSWMLPLESEPRLFVGYAKGSGDPTPEKGADRAFRQSGIQANEAGFGGVQRFPHYGILLDPELSNLEVATLGAGLSLLKSSSLDLVFHRYRLVTPANALRGAQLDLMLTGRHKDLGSAIDVVLAIEEWERVEFELTASAFRAGRALGEERGRWSYGGLLAMRMAF